MTTLGPASSTPDLPLLDVKDLVQRYALPRESLFRPPGEVLALNGVTATVMILLVALVSVATVSFCNQVESIVLDS